MNTKNLTDYDCSLGKFCEKPGCNSWAKYIQNGKYVCGRHVKKGPKKPGERKGFMKGTYESVFNHLELIGAYDGCGEYCEPGYSSNKMVLFGNWNLISDSLREALEEHFELNWSDEWIMCDTCNKYFRITGDCWLWIKYGHIFDGYALCGDCIKANPDEYIAYLLDNPSDCEHIGLNLKDMGFKQLNGDFDAGLYEWQHGANHNPKEIMKKWKEKYPTYEMLFGNLSAEQFQVHFNLYGRERKG